MKCYVVRMTAKKRTKPLLFKSRVISGTVAGLAGALAMNVANHRGSPSGHGAQTQKPAGPPGSRDAMLDPVEKAVPLKHDPILLWKTGTAAHYAMGGACGAIYGMVKTEPDANHVATGAAYG